MDEILLTHCYRRLWLGLKQPSTRTHGKQSLTTTTLPSSWLAGSINKNTGKWDALLEYAGVGWVERQTIKVLEYGKGSRTRIMMEDGGNSMLNSLYFTSQWSPATRIYLNGTESEWGSCVWAGLVQECDAEVDFIPGMMRLQRIVNKQGYGMYEQLTPEERPDLAIGRHFEYVQALPAPLVAGERPE